jgi:hypothetical protein
LVKFAEALGATEGILDGPAKGILAGISQTWTRTSLSVGADDGADHGAEEAGVDEAGTKFGAEEIAELGRVTGEVDREIATQPLMRLSPPLRSLPEHTWIGIIWS